MKRRLRWAVIPMGIATAIALSSCSTTQLHGFLPGFEKGEKPTTNHTEMISSLWVNSWIVLLAVGVITWGLMLWAMIVYRRRKGQTGLPVQMRYNMPMEIFYTVVPLILVLGFFAFTARDQTVIETQYKDPDVCITVYGEQWTWAYQYNGDNDCSGGDGTVYSMGVQAQTDAQGNITDENQLPTLYLPVDKKVKLKLVSRDVAHSFWIIDFLYKKDVLPGHDNYMSFEPTRIGNYEAKCAELCGEYHSMMLSHVKVVSDTDYQAEMDKLRQAGQTGPLDDYNRNQNLPGTGVSAQSKGDH